MLDVLNNYTTSLFITNSKDFNSALFRSKGENEITRHPRCSVGFPRTSYLVVSTEQVNEGYNVLCESVLSRGTWSLRDRLIAWVFQAADRLSSAH